MQFRALGSFTVSELSERRLPPLRSVLALTTTHMDTPTKTTSFLHQAAKLSWVCPIIIFLMLMFGRQAGSRVIIELVALSLIVVGLVLGVVALFGMRTHGKSGILAPAIVGIIINGVLLFIFVTNFLAARVRAQQQSGDVPLRAVQTRQA
jgi:uncharacterized membrane protein YeaQ/YmgE (transglycosylase-associated protein family)